MKRQEQEDALTLKFCSILKPIRPAEQTFRTCAGLAPSSSASRLKVFKVDAHAGVCHMIIWVKNMHD